MKRLSIIALALFVLGASLSGAAFAKEFISIATGGTGGTYYPLGGGIAEILNAHVKDVQVTSETGNASVANMNLIGTRQIEVAFAQNDVAYWAWQGKEMFEKPFPNVRAIGVLYPEHVQMIVTKEAKIKKFEEIKGKRISAGAPGSGVEADVRALFDVAGLTYKDAKVDFLDFNNTTARFKDGQLDAGFVVAGYPTASIMDLATMKDVDLVNFSDDFLKKLAAKYPYFAKSTIPAGTYKGIDHDTQTPAVMAMLVCQAELSDDLVYKITKALWENVRDLDAIHAKAKNITLETALDGLSVPLHPGAEKFYKEKGMSVPSFDEKGNVVKK